MLVKNDTKKEKKETLENKVSLSLREFSKAKILFRLVNNKRENSKSFNIYEKAKLSTNLEKLLITIIEKSISNTIRLKIIVLKK
jgi:hypothetical protein